MTKEQEELDKIPFAQTWRIKECCKAYGWKLTEVAAKMGVSYKTLCNILWKDYPSMRTLVRIAKVIGCNDLRDFFTEQDGTYINPVKDDID